MGLIGSFLLGLRQASQFEEIENTAAIVLITAGVTGETIFRGHTALGICGTIAGLTFVSFAVLVIHLGHIVATRPKTGKIGKIA